MTPIINTQSYKNEFKLIKYKNILRCLTYEINVKFYKYSNMVKKLTFYQQIVTSINI